MVKNKNSKPKKIQKTKKNNSKKIFKEKVKSKQEIDPKDPRIIFYKSLLKEKPKSKIALNFISKYNITI